MPCKVIELNEPNYTLVTKAFIRLVEANEAIEAKKKLDKGHEREDKGEPKVE